MFYNFEIKNAIQENKIKGTCNGNLTGLSKVEVKRAMAAIECYPSFQFFNKEGNEGIIFEPQGFPLMGCSVIFKEEHAMSAAIVTD